MRANVDLSKNDKSLPETTQSMFSFFTENSYLSKLKQAYNSYFNSWDANTHLVSKYDIDLEYLNRNEKNFRVDKKEVADINKKLDKLTVFKVFLKNAK